MLDGQVAVVTGGAQGIGFAVARLLVERGARVASWDIDPGNDEAMSSLGANTLAIGCDITDLAAVEATHARTCDALGMPSILVNSAGISGPNAPLDSYAVEAWHRVLDINLNGTFYVNRVCVSGMKDRGPTERERGPCIAGKEGNPNASALSASKAAVIGLTKSTARNSPAMTSRSVCPPRRRQGRIFDQMSEQHIDYMLSKIPRGRFLDVDEAAG